jgi:hypothetical protein
VRRRERNLIHGIRRDKEGRSTIISDLGHEFFTAIPIASDHRHFRTGTGQAFSQGASQDSGGPDHDGDFINEGKKIAVHKRRTAKRTN